LVGEDDGLQVAHVKALDYQAFLPQLITTPDSVTQTLSALQMAPPATRVLALAPGAAFGDSKRWPEAYFAETANHYLERGWQVWLLGSPDDQATVNIIQTATHNRCLILGGQVSLSAKIDLLSLATVVISNDSGLLHIASALNRPTLGIYGSTTPEFTPPLGQHVAILETKGLACRPCFKRHCPLQGDAHLKCLRDIKPKQVIESAVIPRLDRGIHGLGITSAIHGPRGQAAG
jgi:heptosyltransferase-2